jgi:hypothetical protein
LRRAAAEKFENRLLGPTNQNPAKIKNFCLLPRSGPGGRPPGFAMRKVAIFGFFGGERGNKKALFANVKLNN